MDLSKLLVSIISSFWTHRHLVTQMARRDIVGRYRGSMLGLAWTFLNPLVMLAVYTFLFGVVFRARWGTTQQSGGELEYALVLFVGLIVHNVFAECATRAPTLLLQHASLVKRVVFPLEVLPWTVMASALVHAAISLVAWLIVAVASGLPISPMAWLLPVVLVPLVLLSMGCAWFLTSLGVYVRDIGQIVALVVTLLLFLSPILYPATAVPVAYQWLLVLNPLTVIVEQARVVLMGTAWPDFAKLGLSTVQNLLVAVLGFWWFQRTRRGFADVL